MVDISTALRRLPRVYIQDLKWLGDIDKLVDHIEDSRCRVQEPTEAWAHIRGRIAGREDNRGIEASLQVSFQFELGEVMVI